MMDDRGLDTLQLRERSRISEKLVELIFEYCRGHRADEYSMNATSLELRSIIYGSTHMLGSGELDNTPETMSLIRARIEKNLLDIQS